MLCKARTETIDFSDDEVWAFWSPLIEAVRPRCKTPPQDLRRTLSAVVWKHENGAKWRSVPSDLGTWSRAAQLSIRWSKLGVWQHLLDLCQERGPSLGLALPNATVIRAHEATGEGRTGSADGSEIAVRRWAAIVVAMARRPA